MKLGTKNLIPIMVLVFYATWLMWHDVWAFGPNAVPPAGDASPLLNISPIAQIKTGSLAINTGGASVGLIIPRGTLAVGTTSLSSNVSTGFAA